ncbi:hypothetical protein CNY89_06435 [Amaricoccus sp. HAR-UPW-R2A-40]|nr:hypothetical protein CNY89_06435 [Amaricoccus sp. HAR-UPW-R2A-40]
MASWTMACSGGFGRYLYAEGAGGRQCACAFRTVNPLDHKRNVTEHVAKRPRGGSDPMRRSLCCAALVGLAAAPALALDVCVEGAYPPFSEVTADGTIKGFDIDIAGALCDRLGEACVFKLTRWERMIPALNGDVCDAIVASMSDTDARRRLIDFTQPYYRSPVRFIAPAGPRATTTPPRSRARWSASSAAR